VEPTTLEIAPHLRIVPFRAYPVSPILVRSGYLMVSDGYPDLWLIRGGGLALFTTPRVAFSVEVIYTRYLGESVVIDQDQWSVSAGVGVYF
jgi:hypothetical protein